MNTDITTAMQESIIKNLQDNKKNVQLTDLVLYVRTFFPERRDELHTLICGLDEKGKKKSYFDIKRAFYKEFFKHDKEANSREALFANW